MNREAVADLVATLRGVNDTGVPVVVRFAHEMNGSWYAWGQQPKAYVKTFRAVAKAVHEGAPGSSMMWAPNYGGGYPFLGGAHEAKAGSKDAKALDTNGDRVLDAADDSYAPYYPGDEAVDYRHAGVDERVVPDFYDVYGHDHGKPVAITETGAFYVPGGGGAKESTIKRAWWRQAFAPDLLIKPPG